jgi:hypothetical protein
MKKKNFEWDEAFYSFFNTFRNDYLVAPYEVDIRCNANIFRVRNGKKVVGFYKLIDGEIKFSKKLKG